MSEPQIQIFSFANQPVESFDFTPAAEKILHGAPDQHVDNLYSGSNGAFSVGFWEGDIGKWRVAYSEEEYCELLEGVVELTKDNGEDKGENKRFKKGDRFIIPSGFTGTWEVIEKARKIYVIYEAK